MNAPSKPHPTALPSGTATARPKTGKLDVQATHKRIAKRYPKALAELAK